MFNRSWKCFRIKFRTSSRTLFQALQAMLSRKELWVVVVTAFFTLATIGVLDKFLKTHAIDHSELEHSSAHFALRAGERHSLGLSSSTEMLDQVMVTPVQAAPKTSQDTPPALSPPVAAKSLRPQQISTSTAKGIQCPASVAQSYASADAGFTESLAWCKAQQSQHGVNVGHSWGTLSKEGKLQWDAKNCNELIKVGRLQSCDQRWGWGFFAEWLDKAVPVVTGVSNVTCARNVRSSAYCQFGEVMVDFGKIRTHHDHRSFDEGFLVARGQVGNHAHLPTVPGFKPQEVEISTVSSAAQRVTALQSLHTQCDVYETRPTFVLSNDDIFNLGHYYNDLVGVWAMLTLAGVDSKQAVLLNMDGLRASGPAGGSHRLMVPGHPDEHGPYAAYFKSWFGEVQKTASFGAKKVCYKELYLPPMPGVAWFWNDWGIVSPCSMQAASPLYQSYNLFMRQHWRNTYGATSLPNPPTDVVHVVIEVRAINPHKRNNHSQARHISNLNALIAALEAIPGVKVTAQDFAKIPFEEQVALSHSAGVFISMHGAGTTHIFHAALGQPNCCVLIELFPDTTIEFHVSQGYGNLARMLGLHHWRHVADLGTTRADGTKVDTVKIAALVTQAVEAVRTKPTCLHNVQDTSKPVVYGKGAVVFSH